MRCGVQVKLILAGGTGQLGNVLARYFARDTNEVVVLSRSQKRPFPNSKVRWVSWDGKTPGAWQREIENADVVINLAGRTVNCRYSRRNRDQILRSRIDSTRAIGEAISRSETSPKLWLQSSTATIYPHCFDRANDEDGIVGGGEKGVPKTWNFSVDVAKRWEQTALDFASAGSRLVLLRTAMVMSPDPGGVFDVLMGLTRRGLGGRNASGQQFVSWIHELDFVRSIEWICNHAGLSGPINICSPNPIPNSEFMRQLRIVAGVNFGLPASRWMLELGALLMKTETELVLKSRKVIPSRLLHSGFEFQYPTWKRATEELIVRWTANRSS
jgi:uncharacterized protein (TIGR01777 family)